MKNADQVSASPKAMILAVGTELTEGQISNRNAAWISEQLAPLGISVIRHETVADDREAILASLNRALNESLDLLFVTGGLGPTSDDFTREVASEWTNQPLVYREASWEKIVARLSERGIEVAESNRQQCHFPKGADVIENQEGTADAFSLKTGKLMAYFLPGPPREISHLWEKRISRDLKSDFPSLDPKALFLWKCIGKSEASLGEVVETALAPFSFERGYRASPPYVEVKLWIHQSALATPEAKAARETLDQALLPYAISKDQEDLAESFLSVLQEKGENSPSFLVLDLGSEGNLTSRLLPALRKPKFSDLRPRLEILTRFPNGVSSIRDPNDLPERSGEPIFALFPGGVAVFLNDEQKEIFQMESPYSSELMRERLHSYYTEKALAFFRTIATFKT
jgi:nicotinamide-nucleotide amidase